MKNYKNKLATHKGRRGSGGGFSALPHEYFQSQEYARLSPRAVKLLIDMYCQYRGNNNGDLTATWSIMRRCGWTSKSQLKKALDELERTGWLLRTRQGSINAPTLYAVTFRGIDHCGGKLETGIKPDSKPLHLWRNPEYAIQRPPSRRRVKTMSPDLHTGDAAPLEGSIGPVSKFLLPRMEGRFVEFPWDFLPFDTGTFIDVYQGGCTHRCCGEREQDEPLPVLRSARHPGGNSEDDLSYA